MIWAASSFCKKKGKTAATYGMKCEMGYFSRRLVVRDIEANLCPKDRSAFVDLIDLPSEIHG